MNVLARDLAAEMAAPKYARIEWERRWLVDKAARPDVADMDCTLIEDRYLEGTRLRLRRMTRNGGERTLCKLTKKYETDRPEARPIVTVYLSEAEFALFRDLPARRLDKRRYHLVLDGRYWSLDLFEGELAGLELVEAEAADEADLKALRPPIWAGREITDEPQYQCGSLARSNAVPGAPWPAS